MHQGTQHPLINVVDWSNTKIKTAHTSQVGWYGIALSSLESKKRTLFFTAPGHTVNAEKNTAIHKSMGRSLVFHPDLILGTALAKKIREYSFFGYQPAELLHLLPDECQLVFDCLSNIEMELEYSPDRHSKKLLASHLERVLNYCERFYSRQFILREDNSKGVLKRLEAISNQYFTSDNPSKIGIPSVSYFADKLNLSANYLGDLMKKETGKSAQEFIQNRILDEAKHKIFDGNKTINEIAYELGFKYPQHFSRFFRNMVGQSPNAFKIRSLTLSNK